MHVDPKREKKKRLGKQSLVNWNDNNDDAKEKNKKIFRNSNMFYLSMKERFGVILLL
jgi:hypothetical protein